MDTAVVMKAKLPRILLVIRLGAICTRAPILNFTDVKMIAPIRHEGMFRRQRRRGILGRVLVSIVNHQQERRGHSPWEHHHRVDGSPASGAEISTTPSSSRSTSEPQLSTGCLHKLVAVASCQMARRLRVKTLLRACGLQAQTARLYVLNNAQYHVAST